MEAYMTPKELYFKHKIREFETPSTLYKMYINLSNDEINEMISIVLEDNDTKPKEKINIFLYLALFSYNCGDKLPKKVFDYLIENDIFYYGEIYFRADESTAQKLIYILENHGHSSVSLANHLLCAISAIPCEVTKDFLIKSSKKPLPLWAEQLHILPIDYSKVSGWQIDQRGQLENLYFDEIIPFERCDKSQSSALSPIKPLKEVCSYCHQPLTLVFNSSKKLSTCLYCSCYQTIYVKQDGENVFWHNKNKLSDFFIKHPQYMNNDEEISQSFVYGIKKSNEIRKATYTANQFAEISRTQIGGMPTAINDSIYPTCPDCSNTMKFAAQLDMEDIEKYGEGIYYFFTCENCNTHACNYDQT